MKCASDQRLQRIVSLSQIENFLLGKVSTDFCFAAVKKKQQKNRAAAKCPVCRRWYLQVAVSQALDVVQQPVQLLGRHHRNTGEGRHVGAERSGPPGRSLPVVTLVVRLVVDAGKVAQVRKTAETVDKGAHMSYKTIEEVNINVMLQKKLSDLTEKLLFSDWLMLLVMVTDDSPESES